MIKVTVTLEAIIDPDELGSAYTNEDLLLDEVKEHIQYGLERFGIEDVTFVKTDVDGL